MKKKTATLNAVNKSDAKTQQVGKGDKKAQVEITAKPTENNLQSSKPISALAELAKLREVATQINPLAQLISKNKQRAEKHNNKNQKLRDIRIPLPGSILEKKYKGHLVVVKVLEHGFEYNNKYFKTLSAVACAITGQHLSGYYFFGL
ncbi:DUF2924 domain-containing protein [Candidatus Avelusimicrobium sp.]|uniref:DUF2924 domain-containing protein n=1 Tax=Candidatus Avelusimicrobium sp. TaxID=3048833 RepID=UPI003D7EBA1C